MKGLATVLSTMPGYGYRNENIARPKHEGFGALPPQWEGRPCRFRALLKKGSHHILWFTKARLQFQHTAIITHTTLWRLCNTVFNLCFELWMPRLPVCAPYLPWQDVLVTSPLTLISSQARRWGSDVSYWNLESDLMGILSYPFLLKADVGKERCSKGKERVLSAGGEGKPLKLLLRGGSEFF